MRTVMGSAESLVRSENMPPRTAAGKSMVISLS
jgi:hypothetical protein